MPSACEVDVAGVVSMYTLALATRRPPDFVDWNNNVGDDPNLVACTHCGNYPKGFFADEIEISNLDVLGASLQNKVLGGLHHHCNRNSASSQKNYSTRLNHHYYRKPA
jgi:L-fucose isomerase-like protein